METTSRVHHSNGVDSSEHDAIVHRKQDHIDINLHRQVRFERVTSGLERVRMVHDALPGLHLEEVDTSTTFLGHALRSPLLISSMTGGIEEGGRITRRLAEAAQETGCALGVGSQRIALQYPEYASHFQVRDVAPTAVIFANVGAVQLNTGIGVDDCRRAVDMVEANALILHLNPLQEALQTGGDHDFRGLEDRIAKVCDLLPVPVIVKEIGFGISGAVARRLLQAGVSAIDVSGAGGTSWSAVEAHRAATPVQRIVAETFADWGIPTADCIQMVRSVDATVPIVASGGLSTGVDMAKALALGANLCGFAGPLLRAAVDSTQDVLDVLDTLVSSLRIAMFCVGAGRIDGLNASVLANPYV